MKRWIKVLWPIGLVSMGLLVAAALSARGTAQAQTAIMKVEPASQTVDIGDGKFTVDIVVENVSNLGAFEFTLSFKPSVLRLVEVEEGAFLGSTERNVYCPRALHYSPAPGDLTQDAVRFGCVSSDEGAGIPGPSGSGVVATVTFSPKEAGTSKLGMGLTNEIYGIADTFGESLTVTPQSGSVEVVGSGPEATPEPDEPTPIPTEPPPPPLPTATPGGPVWLTPEPGQTPLARLLPSSDTTTGSGSDGSTGTSAGAAGTTGATGASPVAGTGPPAQDSAWWPALAGGLLAVGGAILLSLAVYLRGAASRRRIRE